MEAATCFSAVRKARKFEVFVIVVVQKVWPFVFEERLNFGNPIGLGLEGFWRIMTNADFVGKDRMGLVPWGKPVVVGRDGLALFPWGWGWFFGWEGREAERGAAGFWRPLAGSATGINFGRSGSVFAWFEGLPAAGSGKSPPRQFDFLSMERNATTA